jgi:hypothetical protein
MAGPSLGEWGREEEEGGGAMRQGKESKRARSGEGKGEDKIKQRTI